MPGGPGHRAERATIRAFAMEAARQRERGPQLDERQTAEFERLIEGRDA